MSSPKGGLRPFEPCRFARYTLLNPIAKGGMGEIFLAQMTGAEGFEKLIIIKKILPTLANEGDFVQRFVAEAKILVQLHHGAIAQILDMGVEGGSYYIAMEFVDGKDLRKLITRARELKTRIPAGLALHIIVRILDALAYAHRKTMNDGSELNLVHRDISPQNILVSYEGEVKLIDFGLAKSSEAQQQKTRAGMVVGKIFYMAPEQALHELVDKRSDLYSAGICLWEMLVGKNPFDTGESALMLMHKVSNPEIPSIRTIRPDLPEALDQLLQKVLAPDPNDRFDTAEEMRGRLTTVMLDIDPMAGPESLAAYMRQVFAADFENERRKIVSMVKAIPKQETPLKPEAIRPFAPLDDAPKEQSLSGKRPRRSSTHERTASSKPATREVTEPAGRSARVTVIGMPLEEIHDRHRPDETDPSKTPKNLVAPPLDVKSPEKPDAGKRTASSTGQPKHASTRAEPKTRLMSVDSIKAASLEEDRRNRQTGMTTLPPQNPSHPKSISREKTHLSQAKDATPSSGLKWAIIVIAVLMLGGAVTTFALMKRSSAPEAMDGKRAGTAAHSPAPIKSTSQNAVEPTPIATPSVPEQAQAKPRAPDKVRVALARSSIPTSMPEITQIFEMLTAEFITLEQAHGCDRLAMMCEFHTALTKQHTALEENSTKQPLPPTFVRDRRDFWESLKLLAASIAEQQKRWGVPESDP